VRIRILPPHLLIGSFLIVIILGTVLLALPASSVGPPLPLVDALFMATSAVCVTGLVVVDVGSRLTPFGQAVILLLIQIGGLGIMTFSTFILGLLGRRPSLTQREVLYGTLNELHIRDLFHLLRSIFIFTLAVEILGALLLLLSFNSQMKLGKALWPAIFHSVSAFCNAGFSLFSNSLENFGNHPGVVFTTTFLIILGGLGFAVIVELGDYFRRLPPLGGGRTWPGGPWSGRPWSGRQWKGFSLHAKIVLTATLLLILWGMLMFFLFEMGNALKGHSIGHQLQMVYFQSVTARTAGFNTVPISNLSGATLLLLIGLMFIGAGPGSCAGGIKVTTFGILVAGALSRFRGREDVELFLRRVPTRTVNRAVAVAFGSVLTILAFTLLLMITEMGLRPYARASFRFLEVLFEATSAFGTVGLTTGITPTLSHPGKLLITALMFIGRLGPLTIATAVMPAEPTGRFKYAEEEVMIG